MSLSSLAKLLRMIVNPITGQEWMSCANAWGYVWRRAIGGWRMAAFEDALSAFAEKVSLRSRVFVHDGVEIEPATL